jgi:hypothetical protein
MSACEPEEVVSARRGYEAVGFGAGPFIDPEKAQLGSNSVVDGRHKLQQWDSPGIFRRKDASNIHFK